ncbi:MAG: hypothetical protein MHM6MM_001218 [Cercozoa sp. M6MM]
MEVSISSSPLCTAVVLVICNMATVTSLDHVMSLSLQAQPLCLSLFLLLPLMTAALASALLQAPDNMFFLRYAFFSIILLSGFSAVAVPLLQEVLLLSNWRMSVFSLQQASNAFVAAFSTHVAHEYWLASVTGADY